jgi:hypothetical protein
MKYYNEKLEVTCIGILDSGIITDKPTAAITIEHYNSLINNNRLTEFIEKINLKFDLLIIYEFHGNQKPLNDISQLPMRAIVLYWNFKETQINYFYYPHWLFTIAENATQLNNISTKYLFNCACRNFIERPGKIYNYIKLQQKSYFNNILFSKYKSILHNNLTVTEFCNDIELQKFIEEYNTWEPMDADNSITTGIDLVSSMKSINYDVYKTSLFHIVAESEIDKFLLSEKTYKIFAVGQIPIMCGPQHAVSHLRDLGFDMFDDIIDHKYYDSIHNNKDRIDAMHEILDQIAVLDHNQLLINTATRRMNNFTHLKSANLKESLLNPIIT